MDKPLSTKPEECRYSFFQHTQCEFFPCHKTGQAGGLQLSVLLLSPLCAGGQVRRQLHLCRRWHQGLQRLSGPPWPGQLQLHHQEIPGAGGAGPEKGH